MDEIAHTFSGAHRRNVGSLSQSIDMLRSVVHGSTYETRTEAQADLFEYIEVFYNRSRRHSTLGYSSPVRFLENWISKHPAQHPMAA